MARPMSARGSSSSIARGELSELCELSDDTRSDVRDEERDDARGELRDELRDETRNEARNQALKEARNEARSAARKEARSEARPMPLSTMRAVRDSYDELALRYDEVERSLLWNRPVELGVLFTFARLLVGQLGQVGDVGCGPGHITDYLGQLDLSMVGVDLAPEMVARARASHPAYQFSVGAVEALEVPDGGWAGAVALGTLWHHDAGGRAVALRELARVVRPGGVLLLGWLESAPRHPAGSSHRLRRWLDRDVSLELHFTSIKTALSEARDAGFDVISATLREPLLPHELPARRGFLLARRR